MDTFDSDDVTDEDQSVPWHTELSCCSPMSRWMILKNAIAFLCSSFEDRQVDAYSDAESEG